MDFVEIMFADWSKEQVSVILAALAANPGLTISHHIDFGVCVFHPGWPALLCDRLCVDGHRAVVVNSTDASGEAVIEIKVPPIWDPKTAAWGLHLEDAPPKRIYKPSWFDKLTGRARRDYVKKGRQRP